MQSTPTLSSSLLRIVGALADLMTVERVRRKLSNDALQPIELVPHRGYGTHEVLRVQARVLESRGITPGTTTDPWWRNVAAAYRRFVSLEIPGAVVRAAVDDREAEQTADVEGYVRFELDNALPHETGWRHVELTLVAPDRAALDDGRATAHVLVPDPRAAVGVISDVDDTILHTGLTERAGMLRTTLLHNASTRLPFAGVAAFYRALHEGDGDVPRPIFFVSGSPWNLYDMIERFIELQEIPPGPLFLKDWGIDEGKFIREDTYAYKLARIGTLLATYPDLRFVLIGDSGQHDPEIYTAVIDRWPERIAAVYIRDVTRDPSRDEAVKALLRTLREHEVPSAFGPSTMSAATDAASRGLIDAGRLEEIRRECEADLADVVPV